MSITAGAIRAAQVFPTWSMKMRFLTTIALAAALAALAAPTATEAQPATPIAVDCGAAAATAGGEVPNLHGSWDVLMDVGGTPSFALLAIGPVDGGYGGSLTPARTAPVVLRSLTLSGDRVHLVVASRAGEVLFDGRLSVAGDRMCGIVTYHGGRTFPMLAQKRPSAYPPPPQPQPAR